MALAGGWACTLGLPKAGRAPVLAQCDRRVSSRLVASVVVYKSTVTTGRQIYFWGSVAAIIRAPGIPPQAEVVRPSLIDLFADGSWVIEHLQWTGWGTSVATASGTSSASNGEPSQAGGARLLTPAKISLSSPGPFFGREVYRCFKLTVEPPATDLHGCLTGSGGYWALS